MSNLTFLYNKSFNNENEIELNDVSNYISLLWLLIFNFDNLCIKKHPEDELDYIVELITTRSEALTNIQNKKEKAIKIGFSKDVINCLQDIIPKLPHEKLVADIT